METKTTKLSLKMLRKMLPKKKATSELPPEKRTKSNKNVREFLSASLRVGKKSSTSHRRTKSECGILSDPCDDNHSTTDSVKSDNSEQLQRQMDSKCVDKTDSDSSGNSTKSSSNNSDYAFMQENIIKIESPYVDMSELFKSERQDEPLDVPEFTKEHVPKQEENSPKVEKKEAEIVQNIQKEQPQLLEKVEALPLARSERNNSNQKNDELAFIFTIGMILCYLIGTAGLDFFWVISIMLLCYKALHHFKL